MKKPLICLALIFMFAACVGPDQTSLPKSIEEAKEKNLLLDVYLPSEKSVIVKNEEYFLMPSFTTFKTISKKDSRPNKNFFAFVIKLKSEGNDEASFLKNIGDPYKYVDFHSEDGGIHGSTLGITYDDLNARKKLDTIQIGFLDKNNVYKQVLYIRKNNNCP